MLSLSVSRSASVSSLCQSYHKVFLVHSWKVFEVSLPLNFNRKRRLGRHKSFVLPQRFMNHNPLRLWSEIREEGEPSYFFFAFLSLFISLMFASVTKKSTLWYHENTMKFPNGLAAALSIYHGTKKCQTVECETLPQSAKRMDIVLSSGSLPWRLFVIG